MTKEEILRENVPKLDAFKAVHASRYEQILKAMEQYGKEQYVDGCRATHKKYEFILSDAGGIASENIRLRKLVQAQKELIEMYKYGVQNWRRYDELNNQIKSLEK